jgi:hypothetical protein
MGANGDSKGSKVSRDENMAREPSLRTALAYEAIYGIAVRDLFAGLYETVEQDVAKRAKLLTYRTLTKASPQRHAALAKLVSTLAA